MNKERQTINCIVCNKKFIPIQKTCGSRKCRKKLHRLWELEHVKEINERARLNHYKRICKICGKKSVGFTCKFCYFKKYNKKQ